MNTNWGEHEQTPHSPIRCKLYIYISLLGRARVPHGVTWQEYDLMKLTEQ